ncbi:MAG: polysaccharide deacetylase family protein [Candidatus Eisenbacteria bacterium]|nr:polysaccharide deacetylase family protein [Candidatus Eisenbacteria bacterium]
MRSIFFALLLAVLFREGVAADLSPPRNLEVVEGGEGWVRLRWGAVTDGALKGYRIKYSLSPGVHPSMTDWSGYRAAFSFTTDDGFDDNLVWMKVFDRHDRAFTAFVIPARIGTAGYLRPEDLVTLNAHRHEVGSHTFNHPVLIRNTAFTIRYEGLSGECTLEIDSDSLRTTLGSLGPDLRISLRHPSVRYLADLVDTIDARPEYSCVLDYYPCRLEYCESKYLLPVAAVDIGAAPFQVRTTKGCDSLTLITELVSSKDHLEAVIADSTYRCRSFAYPRHAHDQREMNAVMETGYLGARNGTPFGTYPGYCPVSYSTLDRVSLYQTPMTWGQPPNDSSEAWSRERIRQRIAAWKRDGEWAILYVAHTLADWDSAHVDWVLDEIVADGQVWVAPFGEVAEYVRRFHVTVENPVEGWNDSLTVSAPLRGLPIGPWIHAVVVAYDTAGVESGWSNEVGFRAVVPSVDVERGIPTPSPSFSLAPACPNPTSLGSAISFTLRESGPAVLRVHDVSGRLVATVLDGHLLPGTHEVIWSGTDHSGGRAGAGIYFCRLDTPWGTEARRNVLLR